MICTASIHFSLPSSVAVISKLYLCTTTTGGSGSFTFSIICDIASFNADAFLAEKYSPPVASAIHLSCASVCLSTSNPITWATKSMPSLSNDFAVPQGSASQVSLPSLIKITVAFSSVYFKASAAFLMEWLIGVLPLGLIFLTFEIIPLRLTLPIGERI